MISEMAGRPYLYLADGMPVAAADFPSYVSTGSIDASLNIPLNYGWGGWPHNKHFPVGTWSPDGSMQGGAGAKLQRLSRRVQFSCRRGLRGFRRRTVRLLNREMSPPVFFALVTAGRRASADEFSAY